jgi:2-polyprenyl-3-methyl-5-hydroxy-6-metoxy-1,4-benzoquinol methylase
VSDLPKEEKIGKVKLNYEYYSGRDLYSDGEDVENKILDIVRKEKGYEYSGDFSNWPLLYHLTRQRENIVLPMEISKEDTILEIGAGMGAITGAFARRAKSVDCIELSRKRSLINAERHKGLDNIEIHVGNFQDIRIEKKYDIVMLIGVLEYAWHYVGGEDPYRDFLKKTAGCLKENGRIYIAIENKLGMKYFAGCHEDHLGKPFAGIEGYERKDQVRTFTKSELTDLLKDSGFEKPVWFYPFPDYKLPTAIYSEETIRNADLDFEEFSNYDLNVLHVFSQTKAFAGLKGTAEREIFANSFLVEAKRSIG